MKGTLLQETLADWEKMLRLFSQASNLITSLYLPDGQRIAGPFAGSDFGKYLVETGKFSEEEILHTFESDRTALAVYQNKFTEQRFENSLVVRFLPVKISHKVVGVVVFGWVFDHFHDPIECHNISHALGVPETSFWLAARLQAPTSQEKLNSHEEMLGVLCATLIQQLVYLKMAKDNARLKDELLAMVSHELKTPVTSVLLRVQMMKKRKLTEAQVRNFAEQVEASVQTQVKLIDDLLDAGKIMTGKFSIEKLPIDLGSVLRDSVKTIQTAAEKKKIKITLAELDPFYAFTGDPARLEQAFLNLLTNAVKFTPAGGAIQIRLMQNISHYVLQFSDNGRGIDSKFLPFLFTKFSQEDNSSAQGNAGLGLGLSIVKTIIELHGGSIHVESGGPSKGSTFEIILPREGDLPRAQSVVAERS